MKKDKTENAEILSEEAIKKRKARKSRIAVALFVLLLAVGITGNWYLDNTDFENKVTPISSAKERILGEAQFVDATTEPVTENEYFASARLDRQTARDEAMEKLQNIIDTSDDSAAKEEATAKLTKMSELISTENKIETLIKAKGVSNCLAVTNEDGSRVDIIVSVNDLTDSVVLQIKEIAVAQLGCTYENVTIIESN